jgi:uncharacterized protein
MNKSLTEKIDTDRALKKTFRFRIYAGLNDFLPVDLRQRTIILAYKTPITVGEVAESMGIPLSEVKLILVNSEPSKFSQRLKENDFISLYPAIENLDISLLTDKELESASRPRFILDAHLGKLAKYLRMLGFDTLYRNDFEDNRIISIAKQEDRFILTQDKLLLRSKEVINGYYVRSIEKHKQIREIVQKFGLNTMFRSFTRCMSCNAELVKKEKAEIINKIDDETAQVFNDFFYCPNCDKVFWKGSHFERMEKLILSLLS